MKNIKNNNGKTIEIVTIIGIVTIMAIHMLGIITGVFNGFDAKVLPEVTVARLNGQIWEMIKDIFLIIPLIIISTILSHQLNKRG